MAVAYDIKAIPTVYGARQFRSRLEAKWASFFSLCDWQFEYEPYDLGTWSPDFLLSGATKVLVEVKPITDPDQDVIDKMVAAATEAKWDGDLLLLGVAPRFDMDMGPYESPAIGWLGERFVESEWTYVSEIRPDGTWAPQQRFLSTEEAPEITWNFGRASACLAPNDRPDFTSDELSYTGRMFGRHYKENTWPLSADWLKRFWDRAANRVQWHKR
jgi:hypothetical protein